MMAYRPDLFSIFIVLETFVVLMLLCGILLFVLVQFILALFKGWRA